MPQAVARSLARPAFALGRIQALIAGYAAELAAAVAAMALYWPALGYGFVFDDTALVGADGWPVPLGGDIVYRPLRYASYLVDGWFGGSAAVYHAHNLLLHGAVAALTVALARRLGSGSLFALAGALVVAWHPLAVEVAAYVAGRRDLLCVALGLGALLAQLSSRPNLALLLLLGSTASKESGLVFAAPLLAAWFLGFSPAGGNVRERHRGSFAVVATAAFGVGVALAYGAIGPWWPSWSAAGLALPGRMAGHYLLGLSGSSLLAPEYPQLLLYVDRVRAGDGAALLAGLGGSLVLSFAIGVALTFVRFARRGGRQRESALVLVWSVSAFAAMCLWGGLHEPGVDRHAYLLLPALGVGIALGLSRIWCAAVLRAIPLDAAWPRWCALAALAVILTGEARGTREQMSIWRSEHTLWTFAASRPNASVRALGNAARASAEIGDYGAALQYLTRATCDSPADPLPHLARAAVRCATGRGHLAARDLRRAAKYGASSGAVEAIAKDCDADRPARDFSASALRGDQEGSS